MVKTITAAAVAVMASSCSYFYSQRLESTAQEVDKRIKADDSGFSEDADENKNAVMEIQTLNSVRVVSQLGNIVIHSYSVGPKNSGKPSVVVDDDHLRLFGRYDADYVSLRYFELKDHTLNSDYFRKSEDLYRSYAQSLSSSLGAIFGEEYHAVVGLVLVPTNVSIGESHLTSAVRDNNFEVRFVLYPVLEYWAKKSRPDLKTLAHEIFHVFDDLPPYKDYYEAGERNFSSFQRTVLEETAAYLFEHCVEFETYGKATVFHENYPEISGRLGSLTDSDLRSLVGQDFSPKGAVDRADEQAFALAVMWALWLGQFGNTMQASIDDPRASAYRQICSKKVLGSREGLADYLLKAASDGKDAPQFDPATATGFD